MNLEELIAGLNLTPAQAWTLDPVVALELAAKSEQVTASVRNAAHC